MALYRFVKAPVGRVSTPKRSTHAYSFLLIFIGGAILAWVAWPIVSFMLVSDSWLAGTVAPIADAKETQISRGVLSPVVFAAAADPSTSPDYTNANLWFPTSPQKKVVTPVNTYAISIDKLRIADAMVTVGGDDLNKSLVHYGGTGIPGQYGNAVIFGHSMLPQFYNPKSYKSIFSLLPTLDIGDEFTITYDAVTYTYVVFEMTVTDPTDLSALEQKFDDSYVTLITCVPPGTYWKRLHVFAKLKHI